MRFICSHLVFKRCSGFVWSLVVSVVLLAAMTTTAAAAVRVTNYDDGTVIDYPVALIRGEIDDTAAESVTVTNADSDRPTCSMYFDLSILMMTNLVRRHATILSDRTHIRECTSVNLFCS